MENGLRASVVLIQSRALFVMQRREVLHSRISIGTYGEIMDEIFRVASQERSSYVCFANVHMVTEAYRDPAFRQVVNGGDIVTADGKPVSVFLRLFYGIRQDRVCGMDVLPDLLARAEKEGKSVYFYGTTDDILAAIRERIHKEHPGLVLKGTYSPPFRSLSTEEKDMIVKQINAAASDFLLVALG